MTAEQVRPGPALKDYVRLEAAVTIAHIAGGAFGGRDTAQEEQRVDRSERYARWRWKAYMAGGGIAVKRIQPRDCPRRKRHQPGVYCRACKTFIPTGHGRPL